MAGFAKACRSKADDTIVQAFDRYYEIVTAAVDGAGGLVVKFIGDASLVVFLPERATDGVAALDEIRDAATRMWAEFDSSCEVQANAAIGTVMCGPVGPGATRRFYVIEVGERGRTDAVGRSGAFAGSPKAGGADKLG